MTIGWKAGLDSQMARLRSRWSQAHFVEPESQWDYFTFFLPEFRLPKGWNKTICTTIFQARLSSDGQRQGSPLTEFWIDLPDIALDVRAADNWIPKRSYDCSGKYAGILPCFGQRGGIWDGVIGLPQWRNVRLFLWRQQEFNPNHMTLYTSAMLIRERMALVT